MLASLHIALALYYFTSLPFPLPPQFRLLASYLARRDPTKLGGKTVASSSVDFLRSDNGLYRLARRLCVALNQPLLPEALVRALVPCIVFSVRAMAHHPELCKSNSGDDGQEDREEVEEDVEDESAAGSPGKRKSRKDDGGFEGSRWVLRRLWGLGIDHRGKRRLYVLQVRLKYSNCVSCALLSLCPL